MVSNRYVITSFSLRDLELKKLVKLLLNDCFSEYKDSSSTLLIYFINLGTWIYYFLSVKLFDELSCYSDIYIMFYYDELLY